MENITRPNLPSVPTVPPPPASEIIWSAWSDLIDRLLRAGYTRTLITCLSGLTPTCSRHASIARPVYAHTTARWLGSSHCRQIRKPWQHDDLAAQISDAIEALSLADSRYNGVSIRARAALSKLNESLIRAGHSPVGSSMPHTMTMGHERTCPTATTRAPFRFNDWLDKPQTDINV